MNVYQKSRRSHCTICGIRLSAKGLLGDIRWHDSNVDDKGLYCIPCYKSVINDKTIKDLRT
jgi:hypothetical protein